MRHSLFAILIPLLLAGPVFAQSDTTATDSSRPFQFLKATDDRVWRLNTETGEIAVCTLNGENLVCTTSTDAVKPPEMSYEEWEAAKAAEAAKASEAREQQQAEERAMFLRFLDLIKELVAGAN